MQVSRLPDSLSVSCTPQVTVFLKIHTRQRTGSVWLQKHCTGSSFDSAKANESQEVSGRLSNGYVSR
jgi:hypothetical protein